MLVRISLRPNEGEKYNDQEENSTNRKEQDEQGLETKILLWEDDEESLSVLEA